MENTGICCALQHDSSSDREAAPRAKLHMRKALVSTTELFGVSQGWIKKKKK